MLNEHSTPFHRADSALFGKKVLFFCPDFFGYDQLIKEELEKQGAIVFLYDERASKSSAYRAVLKIFPLFFRRKNSHYYSAIVSRHKTETFDYVLIVRADSISRKTMALLRQTFPKAKLCLHLWDSIKNIKGIKKLIPLFDRVTSFDPKDCDNNRSLIFRPLFYVTRPERNNSGGNEYDLCFCGTCHSDRFLICKRLASQCQEQGLSMHRLLFLQSPFMFVFYKLFNRGFQDAKKSDFSFDKASIHSILEIESKAKVVLDIQHPKQSGLTMRTIEMIGLGKKIITTNSSILNYDFYDSQNISVIDRHHPLLDSSFFLTDYREVPSEIAGKYTISAWVRDVLCL